VLIFASTRVYSNVYNSNRYIPTAIFQTPISQRLYFKRQCLSSLYIYTGSFTPFYNESFTSLLLLHLKMSRLSRLDSSSSLSDDDEPEITLGALHQAHRRYLAMHSSQWGGSISGRQYIHRDREAGHWRLYHDYFSEASTYDASIFRRRYAKLFSP